MLQLLGTPGSPFVRKARIVLEEKGIAHDYVIERPTGDRVRSLNPLGKIPVLVLEDGSGLYDSSVIAEFVDSLAAEPRLIPERGPDRIAVKRWEALGDGLAEAAITIHHERRKPAAKQGDAAFYERQQSKIERALAVMERELGAREFCFGPRLTLADIACGAALGYLDYALKDFDWRDGHPDLSRLDERLMRRPAFAGTVQTEWHY